MTYTDLADNQAQADALQYLSTHRVEVLVLAPLCRTPAGTTDAPRGDFAAWQDQYHEDSRVVGFYGRAAQVQLQANRQFAVVYAAPSWMWHIPPWDTLGTSLYTECFHQCCLGHPECRPSAISTSSQELASAFAVLSCAGPSASRRRRSPPTEWPLRMASLLVEGIARHLKAQS